MSNFQIGYLITGNKPVINDAYKASEEYVKEQQRQGNLYNDEGDIYESAINYAFMAGAKWQKELLSDKACKWLYEQPFEGTMECKNIEALITDFKIKMEE